MRSLNYLKSKTSFENIKQKRILMLFFFFLIEGSILNIGNTYGKGTPWNITPENNADADGGTVYVTVNLSRPSGRPVPIKAKVTVPGDMKPDKKAEAIAFALNMSAHLNATSSGSTVTVEVDNNSPLDEISGIEIDDRETGEGTTALKDDPPASPRVFRAFFNLSGSGITPNGEATLQIGDVLPLVTTSTSGKSSLEIEQDLIAVFNEAYSGSAYTAVAECDGIVVDSVPCPLGIRAGSDDSGLSWKMGMFEGSSGCFPVLKPPVPTLSQWGLIIMGLLLLVAGAVVIMRRSKVRLA